MAIAPLPSFSYVATTAATAKATGGATPSTTRMPKIADNCTCGARAYHEAKRAHAHANARKIAPRRSSTASNDDEDDDLRKPVFSLEDLSDSRDSLTEQPTEAPRKRSLWRKLLGKGPKCLCDRTPPKPVEPIALPAEYVNCISVRVAGKNVPYTRTMQRRCRQQLQLLETINESSQGSD